jgi:enoyl-CoA hydratase/carnithine racemase
MRALRPGSVDVEALEAPMLSAPGPPPQCCTPFGLVPGGGSTQRLPRLIGRGRALEVLLGCNDLSAELAERYGYINRALPADELTPFVDKLAHRITSFPAHTIAHAKAAMDIGAFLVPWQKGFWWKPMSPI